MTLVCEFWLVQSRIQENKLITWHDDKKILIWYRHYIYKGKTKFIRFSIQTYGSIDH